MPKISSIISSSEDGEKRTVVNSRAYGKHVRAKRGTHKPLVVTDAMKKAGELMRSANAHAKVIMDAFKPFCKDLRDGKRWSRLVALFRKQLQEGDIDLQVLVDTFYFHNRRRLNSVLSLNGEEPQTEESGKSVVVKVSSESAVKPGRHDPDKYKQIIIAVFLDANFRASVLTDTKVMPIAPGKRNEHIATFSRPEGARTLIIAMKCIHLDYEKESAGITPGMSVVSVVTLKAIE